MQQAILIAVLAVMVYTVSLDLRVDDFRYVARHPLAVGIGLLAQFVLLPGATWLLTMALDLPPATEAAMMLVAACPGGALSNVVTACLAGIALGAFIVFAIAGQWRLFLVELGRTLPLVVLHNGLGLALGWIAARAASLAAADRRAVVIEGGMQNSGLALGIIAAQFNSDLAMMAVAGLWGVWHIVSGGTLAVLWRRQDRVNRAAAPQAVETR